MSSLPTYLHTYINADGLRLIYFIYISCDNAGDTDPEHPRPSSAGPKFCRTMSSVSGTCRPRCRSWSFVMISTATQPKMKTQSISRQQVDTMVLPAVKMPYTRRQIT